MKLPGLLSEPSATGMQHIPHHKPCTCPVPLPAEQTAGGCSCLRQHIQHTSQLSPPPSTPHLLLARSVQPALALMQASAPQVLQQACWYIVLTPPYSTEEGSSSDRTTLLTSTLQVCVLCCAVLCCAVLSCVVVCCCDAASAPAARWCPDHS
jgi:hypothetical protein